MQRITIGKKLYFGFGAIILLLVIILSLNGVASMRSRKTATVIRDNVLKYAMLAKEMSLQASLVQQGLVDVSATQGKDGLDHGLAQAKDGAAEFKRLLGEFKTLYEGNKNYEALSRVEDLSDKFDNYYALGQRMAQAYIDGGVESGNKIMVEFSASAKTVSELVDSFTNEEIGHLDSAMASMVGNSNRESIFNIILGLIVVAVGVVVAILIAGSINKLLIRVAGHLGSGSEQATMAASQVSDASQSLSQGATEQASSLAETSSSLDELNSMTKQNADNAAKANQIAQEARSSAEGGDGAMQEMQSAMASINDSSDKISKIIKTIEEIAFQTNLLALNAAVEAARAGEHGKGFAVVAEEVRNLAKRSAEAAKETASLIEDNINKAKNGSEIAQKATGSLKSIVSNSKKVADLISEIASASKEQAEGINQVTNAVSQMDQVTQQNASSAEQIAASAEELSSQAESLKGMVVELQQLVGGNAVTGQAITNAAQFSGQDRRKPLEHSQRENLSHMVSNKVAMNRQAESLPLNTSREEKKGPKIIKPEDVIPLTDDEEMKNF